MSRISLPWKVGTAGRDRSPQDPRPATGSAGAVPLGMSYPWRRLVVGLGVLLLVGLLAAGIGSVALPPLTTMKIVASRAPFIDIAPTWPETWDIIIWQLRLPRIVLGAMVGGALALSGATYQGLFRNPLADPYLIGVASGAGLGATIVLIYVAPGASSANGSTPFAAYVGLLPIAAFAGAIASVSAAYILARSSEGLPLTTLILAGVAIASLTGAASALIMIRSDPDLRPVLSWLLGGFALTQWKHSLLILPYLVPCALVVGSYGRVLNILQLDEEHAQQLGVNVEMTKALLIVAASLATAAAVSFSGIIGFVGLVAPHAVRLVWGSDYRFLLPMAAIAGATFLILADLAARTVASPAELPVGVVTAFFGAPFLLYLLRRSRDVSM